ncbi:WGR and DUF4132 domain-containing protein [Virgisporangium aurantiacum]|uniref:WGR domain-containing protein n=1 Tax=Virgisporangium aurantiacum TaxID=175570 RepID=A0A8J3ZB60_9ACTN|nr:DUF4132 domain-containing protein [Virgisporangium aurantiacum]GIJ60749.1 hypothetical protein Vau01_082650 [Virgisporangium aurantiacum]
MQRYELVAGASAKFWEIDRDGVTVTVRFGRIGAAGQAQVKTFDSDAAAEAHRAKLVGEKTKKGYLPIASMTLTPPQPTAAPQPAAPAEPAEVRDEDVLVLPDSWRVVAWPRRDRGPAPISPLPLGRELELLSRGSEQLKLRLRNETTEPDVREAGLAYLGARLAGTDGQDDPFGAAALITALGMSIPYREHEVLEPVADDWVARLGYGFAAAATAELAGLALGGTSGAGRDEVGVVRIGTGGHHGYYLPHWFVIAVRLRTLIADATAKDRDAAETALANYREGWLAEHRAVTSFLLPDRLDWVRADCAGTSTHFLVARLLGGAAHTVDQVRAVEDAGRLAEADRTLPLLATLMIGVGPAIAPVLNDWLNWSAQGTEAIKRTLAALSLVPTDEAFGLLLRHVDRRYTHAALMEAAARFPRRALRLLAGSTDRAVAALLRVHVLSNPDMAQRALATLPPVAAGRVRAILDGAAAVVLAPPEALPPVLRDPPWARTRVPVPPVVVTGPVARPEAAMAWRPGERDAFLAHRVEVTDPSGGKQTWARLAAAEFDGPGSGWRELGIMVHGPDEVTRPRLAGWTPRTTWQLEAAAPALAARYELDVLPALLHLAREGSWDILPTLMPYASGDVALIVADWYSRLKSVRALAAAWLTRHPAVAARTLVPAAVGKAGAARRRAEQALRLIAASGHRDAVATAAATHGQKTVDAVSALIDADPLDALPAKMPVVPGWLDPGLLPPVPLTGGDGALPPDAVRNLCTVFALSTIAEPYAGVAQVLDACEPGPLAGFWWEAFERWQQMGLPPSEGWVLQALGPTGDDETVRRLGPLIRVWPGDGGHTRAVAGLDVLAAIGTDVALMHLNGIAQKVKFKGLRERAQERIADVARGLDLSPDQLADRLVPDFGLDADGSLLLDFGPRRFTVGFDEQLKPYVVDGSGQRRAALPKPGVKDDPDLAPAAAKRFADLKKDVRTVAGDQIRRLEDAMVTRRGWTAREFRDLFVAHPLVVHLVRRLVWGVYDGKGGLVGSLRVAEDRTFADADDEPYDLPDDAWVGVAHPLDLDAAAATWAEVLADYEILQPFPQLGRSTYALTDDEAAAAHLVRWIDRTLPTGRLLGLERRGWRRGAPQDGGVQGWFEREVDDALTVIVDLEPGIVVGEPTMFAEQRIADVWLKRPGDSWWVSPGRGAPFGSLDRVTASELLRDLTEVVQ